MGGMVQLAEVERRDDSVVTVGTFDGVHAGHRVLIRKVVERAKDQNARSVLVTFDPHPREIINPGKAGIQLLTSLPERYELLSDIGLDEMVVIPFDRDFSLLDSETFLRKVIWDKIGIKTFVIGYDHQFGRNREGTIDTVMDLGKELSFNVEVVSRQEVGNRTVSSTAIRNALQEEGDVRLAASLLERSYRLNGTVVHGDKRGKKIGFPTANIRPGDSRKVIPKNGVYAVKVRVEERFYNGMMNIGVRPTFRDKSEKRLEVHLFEFKGDLYGTSLQIRFVDRLRDERAFAGLEDLKAQLAEDRRSARRILG